jgi:hypothetical protein
LRRLLERRDIGRLTAYLMREETANTFMLGNLLYYGVEDDRRYFRCGDYWGYFAGGDLVGAVAFYNNSQCMVYFTDDSVAGTMAAQILDSPVRLVLGSDRCMRRLAPLVRTRPGRIAAHSQLFMEQGGSPLPWESYGYEFEDARGLSNSRAVQDFIVRCMKDGFGFNITRGTAKRLLKEKTQYEPYLLMKTAGRYVAQAHVQARTPGYCQIGGVCTLPEDRRQGYAKAVVMKLSGMIPADGGRRACLVVNEDNGAARQLYDSLGFRETGRLMLVDFL